MDTSLHILDRAAIHFFASSGLVLLSLFVLRFVQRKKAWPWLPVMLQAQLVLVGVAVFGLSALREAYDVAQGGSLLKSIADYASWAAGCVASVWGLWRFRSI